MIANKWYCIAQTNTFDTSCSVNISFDATSVLFTASVKFGKSSINIASCTIEDGYVLSVRLRETESSWAIDLLSNVKIEPNVSIADSNEWTLNNAEAGSGSIIAIISNIDSKFNSNTGTGGGDSYWQRVNLGSESNPIYAVVPKNFNDLPVHIVSYGEVSSAGYVPGAEGGDDSGSTVVFTPILTSGKEIAKIQIDGVEQSIYAPESYNVDLTGYATEDWVRSQGYLGNSFATSTTTTLTAHDKRIKSFEDIIGIDENGDVYIKKNGDVARNFYSYGEISSGGLSDTESGDGSVVTIEQIVTESNGVPIAVVQIDGVPTIIYAPKNVEVDLTGYATEDWVIGKNYATVGDLDSRISALINGAPAAYDTLKEIADVLAGNVDSIGDIIKTLATKADKSIKVIAGTGLTGGGSLEADRTLSLATSGVTEGTYTKVTVDKYGRVTTATNIASSDVVAALGFTPYNKADFTKANIKSTLGISDWALASVKPSYNFDEIGETPTTLAGYGITDALNSSTKYAAADGVGGNANNALKFGNQLPSYYATSSALSTTNTNLSNHITAYNSFVTATNNSLTNHNNRLSSLESMFEWDGEHIKAKADFYSIGEVSSGGLSTGESTGGATRLEGLEDVYLDNLADGQVLAYDALNDKWVNKAVNTNVSLEISEYPEFGVNVPCATSIYTESGEDWLTFLSNRKSLMGGLYSPAWGIWRNTISVRHGNGSGDGPGYGMYITTHMNGYGNLFWNKQVGPNTWQGEREIIDSGNITTYISEITGVAGGPYVKNIEGEDFNPSDVVGNYFGMTTQSGITASWRHIISLDWRSDIAKISEGTVSPWTVQLSLPTYTTYQDGCYYRTFIENGPYSGWIRFLDSNNYSSYALPLSGGTMNDEARIVFRGNNSYGSSQWQVFSYGPTFQIKSADYGSSGYYMGLQINKEGIVSLRNGDGDRRTNIHPNGNMQFYGGTSGWAMGIEYYHNNGTYIGKAAGALGNNNTFSHYFYGGSYDNAAMYIKQNGNVLIGTTTDIGAKLYVAGNLVATGDMTSGSDARYKRIESYAEIDIETIANAPIINFKWTDRNDDKLHLGSTAQYWYNTSLLNGVIPTDDEKLWTMGYGQIALASVVSVAKKVVNHEERVKILEKRVNELESELNEYRRA